MCCDLIMLEDVTNCCREMDEFKFDLQSQEKPSNGFT